MPSCVRMRFLVGLKRLGPPGQSGLLLGRLLPLSLPCVELELEGRKRSRGHSQSGPGRGVDFDSDMIVGKKGKMWI